MKYYKDKIILTKDFLVDLTYGGFVAVKYSDIKWIYIHNIRTYGIVTTSNLIMDLKDGKTQLICLKTRGKTNDKFMEIINKICDKLPEDCLKGFTTENRKEFKKYKKEL